jgi:phage terminase large subunit GpA-like protein
MMTATLPASADLPIFAAALLDEAVAVLSPPTAPRGLMDFARSLRLVEGPQAGEAYDPEGHPAQREVLRAFASPGWDDYVVLGPVQDGKTWCSQLVPALYCLAELRQPVVYALPDLILARKVWHGKVKPLLHASVPHLLPTSGPGAEGGVPEVFTTTAGARLYLLGAGAKNQAGQSAVTARYVFIDERDAIRPEHVELIFSRCEAYDQSARRCSSSTIKWADSRTLAAYRRSTAGRLWYPCPVCGRFQAWEWAAVAADDAGVPTIGCAHCPHRLTEADRRQAIPRGKLVMRGQTIDADGALVGDRPATRSWGIRWTGLDSPLKSLARLWSQWTIAQAQIEQDGDHALAQNFSHDLLVEPYLRAASDGPQALTWQALLARSQACAWGPVRSATDRRAEDPDRYTYSHHLAPLPAGAVWCHAGIDVQRDRVYWKLIASDRDGRVWLPAWGYDYAREDRQPWTEAELFNMLDRVAAACMRSAGEVGLSGGAVDVGDGEARDALLAWLRGRPGWVPVRGATAPLADRPGDLPGLVHPRDGLLWIDTVPVRDLIHAGLRRRHDDAGAVHIPAGLTTGPSDTALLKHLVAEQTAVDTRGRQTTAKGMGRHDWLDALIYAEALRRWQALGLSAPSEIDDFLASFTPTRNR